MGEEEQRCRGTAFETEFWRVLLASHFIYSCI